MIRFQPDTWCDALLRYFAMAAPNAHVYVEIPAPDLRLAAIVLLAAAVLLLRRRISTSVAATLGLLLLLAATVPWLVTSGNGRYFIPLLVCAGPLAIGLVHLLPVTRAFRLFLAVGLLAGQLFVMMQNAPWGAWAWMSWKEAPYLAVERPASSAEPVTYVTASSISYSLLAPRFPADARWINITASGGAGRDASWPQEFLRKAGTLKLFIPTIPSQVLPDGQPAPEVLRAFDEMLALQRLALEPGARCELLQSRGLAELHNRTSILDARMLARSGFWVCPLRYPVDPPVHQAPSAGDADVVFARVEAMCPRFFPSGEARTAPVPGGAVRQYPSSDMKLYVLDDGEVLYKYWRALNPVVIGKRTAVLAGTTTFRCENIRGRSGLPWEREI